MATRKQSEGEKLYIAEFDEINRLGDYLYEEYTSGKRTTVEINAILSDIFVSAFLRGILVAFTDLGIDVESDEYAYYKSLLDDSNVAEQSVNQEIDGKTYQERVEEHLLNLDGESSIQKIVETEVHRNMNNAIYDVGNVIQESGTPIYKTWRTMLDDRVRDSHDYLEGTKLEIDEEFYTYNGNHALFPGQFGVGEEDVNCRCYAQISFD